MALLAIRQTKCLPAALDVKLPNLMSIKCVTPMIVTALLNNGQKK